MKKRNITLSLPEDLVKRLKVVAAQKEMSISALLTQAAERIVSSPGESYSEAYEGWLRDVEQGLPLVRGTGGKITWSRDSIHER